LGGEVYIVYRRTRAEMPARVEELEHALEEGIHLAALRSPKEFVGDENNFVTSAVVDLMELGEPDASGRRSPKATGETVEMPADLVIMALGNSANPIIKDSEPGLQVSRWGTIDLRGEGTQETSVDAVYTGGDAARGGSTAIRAAGDGQAAAREILRVSGTPVEEDTDNLLAGSVSKPSSVKEQVASALAYTNKAASRPVIVQKRQLTPTIEEFTMRAPAIAASAQAGQFVRCLSEPKGELVPLTLADWDVEAGTITLVVQAMGTSTILMNRMRQGDAFEGIAGPLGRPSELHKYADDERVVFTAGGLGLPPVYPIMREHLRLGNHVVLISGFRNQDLMFWTAPDERVEALKAEFGDLLEVVYTTDDGSFGIHGFVTTALQPMLDAAKAGTGPKIAEVVTIGPPMMMKAVSDLTQPYGVKTVASLNSIMVDATGMCGACMVPINDPETGKLVRKHACIDGPELDSHTIDWPKFLPRFKLFKDQEAVSKQQKATFFKAT
jgi:glutamate synthase (NADPH/NADH) small chain